MLSGAFIFYLFRYYIYLIVGKLVNKDYLCKVTNTKQIMFTTITSLDHTDDFQNILITLNDERVIMVPASELTPCGEAVSASGTFVLVSNAPVVSFDREDVELVETEEEVNLMDYLDIKSDDPDLIRRIIKRAGINAGTEWMVVGRKAGWMRSNVTYKIKAANHRDLLYLIASFAEVVSIHRGVTAIVQESAALVA